MRKDWTLDRYVDELMALARLEFTEAVHPDVILLKSKVLKEEMMTRFTPEQLLIHGIVFENSV